MKSRVRAAVLLACLIVGGLAAGARAHGDLESTVPEAGSTRKRVPRHIYVTLTEAPTTDATLEVRDGCDRAVKFVVSVAERTIHGTAQEVGVPGRWRAGYRAISAVDGHVTQGRFSFTVQGDRDCREPQPTPTFDATTSTPPASPPPGAAGANDDGRSSPTLVLVAVASVVLVGIAFVVRRAGG